MMECGQGQMYANVSELFSFGKFFLRDEGQVLQRGKAMNLAMLNENISSPKSDIFKESSLQL